MLTHQILTIVDNITKKYNYLHKSSTYLNIPLVRHLCLKNEKTNLKKIIEKCLLIKKRYLLIILIKKYNFYANLQHILIFH
jgi:uncharacterized membrane protein (DUF2068 family)